MADRTSSGGRKGQVFTTPPAVSPARLQQASGARNTFGGYTKVNHKNGTFSMRKTGK